MKVSTKWLNEYVDIADLDLEQLAEKIERTAVELDENYCMADGLKKIVVGHILSLEPHPDSDHLNVCQVDVGQQELYQIVCGAPNVAAGQNVIVALPNSWIANHTKIKKSKMRGIVSQGMICSLQELGFNESVVPKEYAEGIYILPADCVAGTEIFEILGMDERILGVDITPNRADLLSMRGVAHEVGAMYGRKVNLPHPTVEESVDENIADYVNVQAPSDLAAPYMMRIIKDVKIKESPIWLQKRLWNAGIRPANNVVDVTNYILLDYGQPLHSFDYDKLGSQNVVVRLAHEGEQLETLDGEKRTLQKDDIVITNGNIPVALAGTMGGANTAVDAQTTTIALEAAVFDPKRIRKTSRRENLHSEAATRFERGINMETVQEALDAAAQMIAQLGEGQVIKGVASANNTVYKRPNIELSLTRVNDVLGTKLDIQEISQIFTNLGFEHEVINDQFDVQIPARRWDITIGADLIEEIARLYGYDNLPTTLPVGPTTAGSYTPEQSLIRQTRKILESSGLSQAISYGLTTQQKAQRFLLEDDVYPTDLALPMSLDHTTLRMNLVSGLLDDAAYNMARKVSNVALYEQGRVFYRYKSDSRPKEIEHVAGILMGDFQTDSWNGQKQSVDFYLTKGIVENLLETLGLAQEITYRATASYLELHPGRSAKIYADDTLIGFIGEVHPSLAKELKLKRVYVFELDLEKIMALPKRDVIATTISKYPSISRDIALAVPHEITNAQIVECIKTYGGKYLKEVKLFDLYQGEHIAKGFKSLAYSLVYSNPQATLVDQEVNEAFNKVVAKLQEELEVSVR